MTRAKPLALLAILTVLTTNGLGCAGLIGATPLRTARPGTTTFHTLEIDDRERTYLLHLPPAASSKRVPLVLLLHGDGASANEIMDASRMNDYADAKGFAVVYPNGTGLLRFTSLHWNATTCCGYAQDHRVDDVHFLDSLVTIVSRATNVDSSHVFAAGFSAGGMLALRLACQRAPTFAAVADVAGSMPDTTCQPANPVSVLFFQGSDDNDLRFDFHDLLRRGLPFARSLEGAMRFWARRDRCAEQPTRDSTVAYKLDRVSCPNPLSVQLYTVARHPHAWPGGERNGIFDPDPAKDVKASPIILDFFAEHGR
jgi:polyhydroxybutyrate depolymerase